MTKRTAISKLQHFFLIRFLSISLLVLLVVSCSSDPIAPLRDITDEAIPLVIKIVEQSGSNVFTTDFIYEETRLIKENYDDGYSLTYTYQDDQLIGSFLTNGVDATEDIIETYTYDSQNRVSSITTNIISANTYTITLTYNTDNSVIEGHDENGELSDRITLSNGNVIKLEEFGSSSSVIMTTNTSTYDDMNSAFKNVEFRDVFINIYSELVHSEPFSLNNILTEDYVYLGDPSVFSTYTYTYNDLGYPTTIIKNYDGEITNYTLTYSTD